MNTPTEKDRETARQLAKDWDVTVINSERPAVISTEQMQDLVRRIASALADERARVRADAKAEVANQIEDRAKACEANGQQYPQFATEWYGVANQIRQLGAILTPSSGPSYEARIRTEIVERVMMIPLERETKTGFRSRPISDYRDDVLAAIKE